MDAFMRKTTKADQKVALSSINALHDYEKELLNNRNSTIKLRIQGVEEEITIPLEAFKLLKEVLDSMSKGKSIALLLQDAEISTQQAADILSVSRPYVVKLLEEGLIPYKMVGTHRRIELKDLLEYKSSMQKNRRRQLDDLAEEAQRLNLGYG